jgi:hypothetical protein
VRERLAFALFGVVAAVGLFILALPVAVAPRASAPAAPTKAPARPIARQSIPSLFSTGLTPAHKPLADGQIDPHWTLEATPVGAKRLPTFVTATGFPVAGPWTPNRPAGRWISPQAQEAIGDPPGKYVYRTTFDLSKFDPATARLTLQIAVDNGLEELRLNDAKLGFAIAEPNGFQTLSSFEVRHGFRAGVNVLELATLNSGNSISPSGVQVLLSGTAVPLPSEEGNAQR